MSKEVSTKSVLKGKEGREVMDADDDPTPGERTAAAQGQDWAEADSDSLPGKLLSTYMSSLPGLLAYIIRLVLGLIVNIVFSSVQNIHLST